MILLLLAVVLLGVSVHRGLEVVSYRRRETDVSLRRAVAYGGRTLQLGTRAGDTIGARLVGPMVGQLAGFAARFSRQASPDEVAGRLRGAGLPNVTPTSFLAVKGALSGGSLLFGLLLLVLGLPPLLAVLVGGAGAYVMLIVPESYLSARTRRRKEDLLVQMPDVLDLLTVSIEAGLGFDAALLKVGERMRGPLVEELAVMTHEMRIGESRANALRNFAARLDLAETTTLARAITQADQLGIALSRILRVQSQELRHRRQMQAEEKAMKAPVKMLIPTAVFIFPAMFVVVLGPAVLTFAKGFGG